MPSTYSPSLRIELIGAGEQSGTWGTTTNNNLGTLLEQSIAGVQAITMVNANYTLTSFNGVTDEARKAVLVVGGTNGAIRDIITPLAVKSYIIKNNTVGGFAINIRAATGASVSIPNGVTSAVYCDGVDFQLALTQTLIAAGTGISIATVGATSTITNTSNFVSGTRLSFAQITAPTGWTQDTTDLATNRMLRVINTTTGVPGSSAVGGSASPILNNTVPSHTHTFTGDALPGHTHTDSGHSHSDPGVQVTRGSPAGTTSFQEWVGSHSTGSNSPLGLSTTSAGTPTGTNAINAGAVDWAPRYVDMIICSKI